MLQPAGMFHRVADSARALGSATTKGTDLVAREPAARATSDAAAAAASSPLDAATPQAATGAGLISNGMPSDPQWYQRATFYQARVDSFADGNGDGMGDFAGMAQHMDHVQDLGADAIWITPFMRDGGKDGGYDISDFRAIDPKYGTMADFEDFVKSSHERGVRVVTELVLNHSSDQHRWFTDEVAELAKVGRTEAQRRVDANETKYVWDFGTSKEDGPPNIWKDTRVIFQDYEPSNWTWNDDAEGWFWHRFFKEQPDLNWENPTVRKDMTEVVDFWLDKGVDGIRLDAVPYLYQEPRTQLHGTVGENLPRTHQQIKDMRAHIDGKYADRMLLGEANMPAKETREYFGDGDESHTLFNFPLMPRNYMGTLFGDKQHVLEGLEMSKDIPKGTAWLTFLRNHDEMTLEKVTPQQREAIWKMYREGVPEAGIEADPHAPINLGVRLRLDDMMGHDARRVEMMKSLLYSQPGTPIEYYGDEIGMSTLRTVKDEHGVEVVAPDRFGVRTTMQWSDAANGGFSTAHPSKVQVASLTDARHAADRVNVEAQRNDPTSMLGRTRALIAARQASPALSQGDTSIVETGHDGVVAYRRSLGEEHVVAVTNLTGKPVSSSLSLPGFEQHRLVPVHGSDARAGFDQVPASLDLDPYEYRWMRLEPNGS